MALRIGLISSLAQQTPRDSDTIWPSRRLSEEESFSGVNNKSTRSLPSARAQRKATTALSMPPDTPTTAPLRWSSLKTILRMASAMRLASTAGSIFKISAEIADDDFTALYPLKGLLSGG